MVRAQHSGRPALIEQQARVVGVDGDHAQLLAERRSACGACAAGSGCGATWLAAFLPDRRQGFSVHNAIGARTGDTVIIGLEEKRLRYSSLLLYAVPLAGLLLGAIGGEALGPAAGIPAELGAIAAGLMGLSAALVLVHRRTTGNAGQGVRLLRVVHPMRAIAPGDPVLPEAQVQHGFRERQ